MIVTLAVFVQPLASFTVTVYVPAQRPVALAVVCTGVVFHEYVYGVTPPPPTPVALPLQLPLHVTFVGGLMEAVTGVGWVMVTLAVLVQPLASVIVTV